MARLIMSVLVALTFTACGGSSPPSQVPQLPLTFVPQEGRADFLAQGPSSAIFLARDQIAITLQKPSGKGVALKLRFVGGNPSAITGERRASGTYTYIGESTRSAPGYDGVVYRDVWPGIDMALRGEKGTLKYEFRVQPGADPGKIRLAYEGATGLRADGKLNIGTALGTLTDAPPVTNQGTPVAYAVDGLTYGFTVGDYDRSQTLVIDPALAYSTLLGGNSNEAGAGIVTDAAGNTYVTGTTQSPNFPTTAGAFDRTGAAQNNLDVFVTKLNPTGTAAAYSTFIGGNSFDWGRAITIDSTGAAYVTGQTQSTGFPTTSGAFDRTFNVDNCPRCGIDQQDAFVLKLNPAGSALVYSTFLGGTQFDDSLGIAIDSARNAYVTGQTGNSGFPTTAGAFDRTNAGAFDAFVTKLNPTGSSLVYSTLLGGEDNELPEDIRVDADGNAVVGGSTRSTGFPTTPGAFDTTQNGGAFDERFDLFVTKLNAAGSALVFSTFVGGSKSDFGSDFGLDAAGNSYLVGSTLSPDFPGGATSSFALKLNAAGSALLYSREVPGAGAIAPKNDGSAWVAGGSNGDVFVGHLDGTGTVTDQLTFGGSEGDGATDVALDPAGHVYVTGVTYSPDFRTTPGAFDRTWSGDPLIFWGDAFVAKIDPGATTPPTPTPAPAPAAPTLVSSTSTSPVVFDWSDVATAVSYEIQVDEISQFGLPLVASATSTASTATLAVPDGNWFWRVRAVNGEGTRGAWSETGTLAIGQSTPTPQPVPGTPTLTSPAAGATVSQPFTFDWSDVAAAAWYVIEVDDNADFTSLAWAATTTPSSLATNSLPNGPLFWRVRAFNSDGVPGDHSATRTLTVGTTTPPPTGAPTLISPSNDARFSPGATVNFDWSDVTGANGYTIQIDDSDSFSNPLTRTATTAASAYTATGLPTRRMWWRVRANDGGAWSSARRFELK